jgi:hypothetical protein
MLACTGSACFIARLSSSVEDVDGRKDETSLAQKLSMATPAQLMPCNSDAAQADADTWSQISAATNPNDPTTVSETR